MSNLKKAKFDSIVFWLRFKDQLVKLGDNRLLAAVGRRVIDPTEVTLTYIPVNEEIDVPAGTVAPQTVIEHFINEASYHVALNRCPCRSELKCNDYPRSFGCTFLGEGARQIDPSLGTHISRDEALARVREASEMGLVSVLGRFKGDALALSVKDHARLMTICHCCPCCCVTTTLPRATRDLRDMLVKLEGVTVEVTDDCKGCGACEEACVFDQIEIVEKKAVLGEECKGCGRCVTACKTNAMKITVDNPRYVEECIERISALVDVTG